MVKDVIQVADKAFECLIPAADIDRRVAEIADRINADYAGREPLFLGVMNGAFLFVSDLFRRMTMPCTISFVKVASYNGTAADNVRSLVGLAEDVAGRDVIVVEDIVDTGATMQFLKQELGRRRPASVRLATLLLKPDALEHDLSPDYTGFEIGPAFVVGYGLDYKGFGRNLNDIYILKPT